MKNLLLFTAFIFSHLLSNAQNKSPYVLYNAKGKKLSYKKMIKVLKEKDIVLFGEYHNNAIAHWLQLEVTKDLKQSRDLVLGAEMFEADNQEPLDLYLQGKLSAKGLDSNARL
ncbi:MAG: ChaN family lipoprotein, partial [Chitinophagaceae bacterium]|nr:ChaN family lipoprotein [Chitinophagaceae bacterium]